MAPSLIRIESDSEAESSFSKPTVYFRDTFVPEAYAEARKHFSVVLPTDPEQKNWRSGKYLLIRSGKFTADDAASCPNLVAIGKQGVGTDKIDIAACAQNGIKVFNTPGVNSRAVAELVLTLTTSLARQIRPISIRIANGEVVKKESCSGLILHRCTIGIIGMGNIGKTVAKIFQGAFESRVVAYDPYMASNGWPEIEHERVKTVEEVLSKSDVVTIHVPLTPETQDLINYERLAKMKKNALLINTARGGIVNEDDLSVALSDGLIWGAGLDCHTQEPPTFEKYEKLWTHPNVISMPHVGAATAQTQIETAVAAVRKVVDYCSSTQTIV